MGPHSSQREDADRKRAVKFRKQGAASAPAYSVILPAWVVRTITGLNTVPANKEAIAEIMEELEAEPEVWDEGEHIGIFFRVTRSVGRRPGW